jgi:molybdopterin-guanine dinucleotide biosynthesis protein A
MSTDGLPFGAVLAGGESRRYGSPKALVPVAGVRIIDRVVEALGAVTPHVVLLANEPDLFADLGLPIRRDMQPGLGALGGIHTGLHWAREAGRPGILAVACDMPFPCRPLLERLRDEAFGGTGSGTSPGAGRSPDRRPDVVIPESRGRRGVEPLLAAYRVSCLSAIEAQIEEGDHRMVGFHSHVRVQRVPLRDVESLCDPERAFLNVNTPEERERAERLAGGEHGG